MKAIIKQVDQYEIVEQIGHGGMGVVWRARDTQLERNVAIKTIYTAGQFDAAELEERLLREARAAALLTHPNIVVIYQLLRDDDGIYIVMEFVDGLTLEERLETEPRLAPRQLLDLLGQVASALDYAHSRGFVHRDVKPLNILIDQAGKVRITDFGLAKCAGSSKLTQTGMQLGTPHYMSPEQAQNRPVDGRSDQFSLAVIAYRGLAGIKPFDGGEATTILFKIVYEDPAPPPEPNAPLPPPVDFVLRRALAKNPADRFASCLEFVQALEAACAQAATAPVPPRSTHWPSRVLAGVAAFVMFSALLLLFALLLKRSPAIVTVVPPPRAAEGPVSSPVNSAPAVVASDLSRPAKTPAKLPSPASGKANQARERAAVEPEAHESVRAPAEAGASVKPLPGGMAEWENPGEWQPANGWLVHKGGNAVLYRTSPLAGTLNFAVLLVKGKRLQWVVAYRDAQNYALFQVEKGQFRIKNVVNGVTFDRTRVPLAIAKLSWYQFSIAVSHSSVVTSIREDGAWRTLDTWKEPDRDFTAGRFGFLIPGTDEVGIANFSLSAN